MELIDVVFDNTQEIVDVHIKQKNELVIPPKTIKIMTILEYNLLLKEIDKKKKPKFAPSGIKIDNFLENSQIFYSMRPYFYDKTAMWWKWLKDKWEIVDDVEMEKELDECLGFCGQTISSNLRKSHLRAMMWTGREHNPKFAPLKWIQFKSNAVSLKSGNTYKVTKDYLFTNPIPYEISFEEDTPVIDKMFCDWVGEENKQILYEIMAYCLYRGYPIHRVFFLIGDGSNGKSSFLQLVEKFLGKENICSTELDNIVGNNSSRFETMKMYNKLAVIMGETSFSSMGKTTMLKKLSGHDLIGYEMKGKQPFDDYSYAKLIIASNSLPITSDTTEGLWRRCIVIDFPNKFSEKIDIINTIPDGEYPKLARKSFNILKDILDRKSFTNEGSIEDRKQKYIMASNPLPIFLKTFCQVGTHLYNRYSELYTEYLQFLKNNKKRITSKKEFSKFLNEEGYEIRKTSKEGEIDYYIEGIKYFPDISPISPISTNSTSAKTPYREKLESMEIEEIKEKTTQNDTNVSKITKIRQVLNYFTYHKKRIIYEDELENVVSNPEELHKILEKLAKGGDIFSPRMYGWKLLD